MSFWANILQITQLIICGVLITAILLQQRGGGLGIAFGGSGASYHTKRGFEKILFTTTIIFAILFVIISIISLFIK
ncbi:MAG: preprotein translocase subunit SecG [Patescibacteria group bacterium]